MKESLAAFMLILQYANSLEIDSLVIPKYVVAGESAIVSCYYNVPGERLQELDIKCYQGTSPSPFLVFLPHHWSTPHIVTDSMVSRIEMMTSTSSRLVFRLHNVTKEMSGLFSCKVSTYSDETLATRRLTVIDSPRINISVDDNDIRELEEIKCEVSDVQTQVVIKLAVNGINIDIIDDVSQGRNTLTAKATISKTIQDVKSNIECIVTIPETHYIWRQSMQYTGVPRRRSQETLPYLALVSSGHLSQTNDMFLLTLVSLLFTHKLIKS